MRKIFKFILLTIIIIIAVAAITNPSKEAHQEALRKATAQYMRHEGNHF